MSVTRKQIRTRAIDMVPEKGRSTVDGSTLLTATSGGTSTLLDTTALPPTGASTALYSNAWLHRPAAATAADRKRLVSATGYDGSTKTITHQGPVWAIAPLASGDTGVYEILKDDPDLWNMAINEALRTECFYVRNYEWTPTSNTKRVYDISAAPISNTAIERVTDLHAVQWHPAADTAGEELWEDWANGSREWDFFEDNGTLYLDFRHIPPDTAQELRLIVTNPYAVLTDETTPSNVDLLWAAAATITVMARWLGESDAQWRRYGAAVASTLHTRRRQELREYAYRTVGRESQYVGGMTVGGRGGYRGRGVNRRTFHY